MSYPEVPSIAGLSAVQNCNCVSLRRASRRISLYYDASLAPVDLRATQFSMLAALAHKGPLSVNGLASLLDMDRSTAGQNVKLLERDGLMAAVRSPTDGRSRVLHLTAAGQAKLSAALPLWQEAQQRFETLNGAAESAVMRALLTGLRMPGPVNRVVVSQP